MIVSVRIRPGLGLHSLTRYGYLFTEVWRDIDVDPVTVVHLRAEQYLEVIGDFPVLPEPGPTCEERLDRLEQFRVLEMGDVSGDVTIVGGYDLYVAVCVGPTHWLFETDLPISLELTNGGAHAQTWAAPIKWPNGAVPALTAVGVDCLEFYPRGAFWRGGLAWRDSK